MQIENYREALIARGVPEGKWLENTLATHRAGMLEQEGYNLAVASGHEVDSKHSSRAYQYPSIYSEFYDKLAGEFSQHCLSGTNPSYNNGSE